MGIVVRLDKVMADRKISSNELSENINLTRSNLSNLKRGKVRAIRFDTLESICKTLKCQPGDILEYVDKDMDELL